MRKVGLALAKKKGGISVPGRWHWHKEGSATEFHDSQAVNIRRDRFEKFRWFTK